MADWALRVQGSGLIDPFVLGFGGTKYSLPSTLPAAVGVSGCGCPTVTTAVWWLTLASRL